MQLNFPGLLGCTCCNYAEITLKQYVETLKMQHNKPTHIVLTIYNALCGLHKTAHAV